MVDSNEPGSAQRDSITTHDQIYQFKFQDILDQVKGVPGKDFKGFDVFAEFRSPIYRTLPIDERKKIWLALQYSKTTNADVDNGGEIIYWFDANNGGRLAGGNLYRIFRTEKKEIEKLLLSAPLRILCAVKTDFELKIKYEFAGEVSIAPIRELVAQVSLNMRSVHDANKTLSELLYKYLEDQNKNGKIVIQHEPIYIEENIIRVAFDTTGIDVGKILSLLRDFYPSSTNPHAFLSGLAYNLIAPLAYFIRTKAPFGYLLPIRMSYGRTGGAKTSMDSIFVIKGFAQTKEMGVLTNEQVATPFTLQKNMESTMLPVIINDVDSDWLFKVSTVLKNSSENPIAGDRGNPDQSITRRQMRRAINITSNDIVVPSDDAAKTKRYILEEYTDEHVKRQNLPAFHTFVNALAEGFMFAIFHEVFEGAKIDDVIKDVTETQDTCSFVNYALNLINIACTKHGVDRFPKYENQASDTPDSFSELVDWLKGQWNKINETDDFGRAKPPYPEISRTDIDVDETNSFVVFWFTGAAYKVAQRKLNLPHKTVSALFANYVQNTYIEIAAANKSHKFNGQPGRGFALRVCNVERVP